MQVGIIVVGMKMSMCCPIEDHQIMDMIVERLDFEGNEKVTG